MASSSFRQNSRPQPHRYRTPSPPRQHIEAITPTANAPPHASLSPLEKRPSSQILDDVPTSSKRPFRYQYHHRDSSGSGLEVFASIALATTDASVGGGFENANGKHGGHERLDVPGEDARPYKRPKTGIHETIEPHAVEKQTPASASAASDAQKLEAELLLNFSREAHEEHHRSASLVSSEKFLSPTFSSWTINPYPPTFDESPRQSEFKVGAELNEKQEQVQNGLHNQNQYEAGNRDGEVARDELPHPHETAPVSLLPLDPRNDTLSANLSSAEDKTTANGIVNADIRPDQDPKRVEDTVQYDSPLDNSGNFQAKQAPSSTLMNGFLQGIEEAANAPTSKKVEHLGLTTTELGTAPLVARMAKEALPSVCSACNFTPDSLNLESPDKWTHWIICDACQAWFHFACAGFRSERETRAVDKFRCKKCEKLHGLKTTFVRKSSRTHNEIDYAGLNEGILKTSDADPEHHYIKHFKSGNKWFQQESFPRMRPEDITAEFFGRGDGMKMPIVIPAELNARPPPRPRPEPVTSSPVVTSNPAVTGNPASIEENNNEQQSALVPEAWPEERPQSEFWLDNPDALDMVMPRDLTVRKVAELYGPEEKIEVINVKSQNGEDKRWNMRRWADYYENKGKGKVVRNVISLEISHSQLHQLIQRPRIVRELDLQDSVWPADLKAKGEYPKVQEYCLMSVADCFTDFHIDFGGSSVFYHILKGKKTFFFVPPHDKHLKKYEEWCNSPAQNWTFLGEQTKECYRVDLSKGDTMLIPAGWIHAVWTPEDSLVIGGNFLTRMHYPLQIRIAQIEKATHVARKFRYPYFQKLLWYTALRYLDDDPLPNSVKDLLTSGHPFSRARPTYIDSDEHGDKSTLSPEYSHKRFYPKAELDGLPALGSYLLRTVRVAMNCINESITTETRNAVKRSIPKGHRHGEPLEAVQKFAMWYTWKRGNEPIPEWAYPDFIPEGAAPEFNEKKPSVRTQKKMEREAAYQAFKVAPERQSMRARTQPQTLLAEITANRENSEPSSRKPSPAVVQERDKTSKRKAEKDLATETPKRKRTSTGESKTSSPRQRACEACRKARRACKHRDDAQLTTPPKSNGVAEGPNPIAATPASAGKSSDKTDTSSSPQSTKSTGQSLLRVEVPLRTPPYVTGDAAQATGQALPLDQLPDGSNANAAKPQGRAKACEVCRRSKVIAVLPISCSHADHTSVAASMTSMATRIPSRLRRRPFRGPLQRNDGLPMGRSRPMRRRLRERVRHPARGRLRRFPKWKPLKKPQWWTMAAQH